MYSRAAQEQFVKSKLCQDDPKLYELFQRATTPRATETDRQAFRKKLGPTADVSDAVQTFMTDACRPLIYSAIRTLSTYMLPMGYLIITGGDAFNNYFPKDDRVVTTDIDTKFCPFFLSTTGLSGATVSSTKKFISSRDPRMFKYLQITKVLLWDRLGKLCQQLNARMNQRLRRLANSAVGKLLQIRLVKDPLRRRYTLMPKTKQGAGSVVKEGDVLIDVELFAMDCKIKYLGRRVENVGGMLDIAFMRPSELGYDVLFSNEFNKEGLRLAGKKFLMEDLYVMQALHLRPQKAEKDRQRMYILATKVLKVPLSPSASIRQMYLKTSSKIKESDKTLDLRKKPMFNESALLRKALTVKMNRYPSTPSRSKLSPCISDTKRPGFTATKSTSFYSVERKRWVTLDSDMYIRNMATYRGKSRGPLSSASIHKSSKGPSCRPTLYGYNPARNHFPKKLVQKAIFLQGH